MVEGFDYKEISGWLKEYSGSDIRLVCKEAAMKPLRRLISELEQDKRKNVDKVK